MPRKFKTNKGIVEFPDDLTTEAVEKSLMDQGVTEYEDYVPPKPRTGKEIATEMLDSTLLGSAAKAVRTKEPLSFGQAAASFSRAPLSAASARTAAKLIPHPIGKVAGTVGAYVSTDQGIQEIMDRVLGGRPQGIAEQIIEPGNEVAGRLMGTAENAALDWTAGKIIDGLIGGAKNLWNRYGPLPAQPPQAKPGVSNVEFSTDPIKDAQYWDIPNPKPAQPSIPGYGNEAAAAEYAALKAKSPASLTSTEKLKLAGIERKLLAAKTKTIDLPGQTIHMGDGRITNPSQLLEANPQVESLWQRITGKSPVLSSRGVVNSTGELQGLKPTPEALATARIERLRSIAGKGALGVAVLGTPEERKEKLKNSQGPIPEFEMALQDPYVMQDAKDDLKAYWLQKTLQGGNLKDAMKDPASAALYTDKERAEIGEFFKAVDEKRLPSDIQIGPKGVNISGPMAEEAGFNSTNLGISFVTLASLMLLRKGSAAKAVVDYMKGNASKIPARRMGKYFLRNALRGADVLLQTTEGEEEVRVE